MVLRLEPPVGLFFLHKGKKYTCGAAEITIKGNERLVHGSVINKAGQLEVMDCWVCPECKKLHYIKDYDKKKVRVATAM